MPPTVAKRSERTPSVAETGKCSRMMSFTDRFCWVKEIPKSPLAMFPRNTPYWTSTGLSRPYRAFRFARTSALRAFPEVSGSPGTACIAANVAVAMKKTVTRPARRRFSV